MLNGNVEGLSGNTGTNSPLAHVFIGSDGGAYYVTEVGNEVYWFAEHPGRDYAHVFRGTRQGDRIEGRFLSVPKDRATSHGQVAMKVLQNGWLERIGEGGGFPCRWLSVAAIEGIVDRLPGKPRGPGFTANTAEDLDGLFTDATGRQCYMRQYGNDVVFFVEDRFERGQQPKRAFVFVGTRQGTVVKGKWAMVPKGKATGSGSLELSVGEGRKLMLFSGSPLGSGTFDPHLPPIRVPISWVMKLANAVLSEVRVHLDGFGGGTHALMKGSYIKFGAGEPEIDEKFTLQHQDGAINRYFLDDMDSEHVFTKYDPTEEEPYRTRLTIDFEDKGREIKRIRKRTGRDDGPRDWDFEQPRCNLYFNLVNYVRSVAAQGKSSRPAVTYEVTDVELEGELDAPGLIEAHDDKLTDVLRPMVESSIFSKVNLSHYRDSFVDKIQEQLDALVRTTDQYEWNGYSASDLVPKRIAIDGGDVVFYFD